MPQALSSVNSCKWRMQRL